MFLAVLAAIVVLYGHQPGKLIQSLLSIVFYGALIVLFYNFALARVIDAFTRRPARRAVTRPAEEVVAGEEEWKTRLQDRHAAKAEKFKAKILAPREEARQKRMENNLRFSSSTTFRNSGGHRLGDRDE